MSKIPSHWRKLKLRQILRSFSEKNHADMQLLSVVREKGVIQRNVDDKEENHNFVPDDLSNYKLVKRGQFAMNKMKAWQGSYGVSDYDGIVSPAYFVFDIIEDINKEFFNVAIRSKAYIWQFGRFSEGVRVGQWDLDIQKMKEIPFYVPPRAEQDAIVRFLDAKIAQIDRLIALKEQQIIELLNAKQQYIDTATIHGLRGAMLKHNSDIRWRIDYPCNWGLKRLRESFSFRKGLSITKENLVPAGIPVISYGQIHAKSNTGVGLNDSLIRYVGEEYLAVRSAIMERGDFVFADTSEDVDGCGNCAYIETDETIMAGYHAIIAHHEGDMLTKYLAYLFRSDSWRYQIRRQVNGVKVYSITQRILKDAFYLIPPLDEQVEIVKYLDEKCSKIDVLITSLRQSMALLSEVKTSLIADVVTGRRAVI